MHGGPWGGCQECHQLEQVINKAASGTEEGWLKQVALWREHLATD